MPVYVYRCQGCGEQFERLRGISDSDEEVDCPRCGQMRPRRLITRVYSPGSPPDKGNLRFPT